MRFIFLIGGAAGFTAAAATDYLSDFSADRMLLDGAIGCLVGAFLFRWFWNVLLQGIREAYIARQRAEMAAAAATATAPAIAKPKA